MMLQAVAHDVKNKLAELAMRLLESDIEAAALALDSAEKLSQALLIDQPEQLTPHIDSTCPVDLIEELSAVYRQLFPDKAVTTDTARTPQVWYYDVALMRLALSNALHNALKHCTRAVHMSAYPENEYLLFEVRDDGAGFQHDVGATHSDYATGLGLCISERIVRAHRLTKTGDERAGWMRLANDRGALVTLAVP